MPVPVAYLAIVVVIVGLLWLANTRISMTSKTRGVLNAVIIIAVVLWLLGVFGLFSSLPTLRVDGWWG